MSKSPVKQGVKRGLRLRCPNCGEGRLFRRYLKVEATCPACGHDNGRYPADDGPAYITILLVGHLVIAPILLFPFVWTWHPAATLGLLLPLLAIVTLTALPFIKGGFVGLLWAQRQDRGPA